MHKPFLLRNACFTLSFILTHFARAAVFNIPDGDVAALKSAIATSNSNGQADVINLANNGIYTLTVIDNTSSGPNGLPTLNDDVAGLDLTFNGNGATIRRSASAGTPEFRILMLNPGVNVSCNNLTIASGSLVTGSFPANRGGGISIAAATLALTNCTMRDHSAVEAGAIWNSRGTLTMSGCLITANTAVRGGGIWNLEGSVSGSSCTFSENVANGTANTPGLGGAIYNLSSNAPANLNLSGCQFTANRITGVGTGRGGAIYNQPQNNTAASVSLTNCNFSGNFGEEAIGGALSNQGGSMILTGGKLDQNYARDGGAIEQGFGQLDLRGVTFEDNDAYRNSATNTGGYGGAILITNGGALTLRDSAFTANEAGHGGGAIFNGGTAAISNTEFTSNGAMFFGGAIRNDSQLTLSDSRLVSNVSSSFGGGVMNTSSAILQRCTINLNTSGAAGGIANCGTLTLESSTLDGNRAEGSAADGGAIGMLKLNPPINTTIRNSTLSNNVASRGAGVYNLGTLEIFSSTFSVNIATGDGGALCNRGGNCGIYASTLHGNSAAKGGGIYNAMTTTDAQVALSSTILRAGSGGTFFNLDGALHSYGNNLSSDAAGGDGSTGPGGLLNSSSDIRNTDPNLGPLQDNGGPTRTHALLFPSAAMEKGNDEMLDSPFGLTSDQRGLGFARRIGAHVDIGAYEAGTVLRVTTTDDHNDGACTAADCTLREAIVAANAAGPSNISFAPKLNGIIQLGGELPPLGQSLSLQGPGAKLLTVRRNGGGDYRIFTIRNGTSAGPAVRISGLTIRDGRAPDLKSPNNSGGGILNDRGSLFVSECILIGNRADQGEFAAGGAIRNLNGDLTIEESTLSGNVSTNGGGVASERSTPGTSALFIRASTMSGNTASGGSGGGVYSGANGSGAIADLTLYHATLSGNSATASGVSGGIGGAILNVCSTAGVARARLEDCTLTGNSAPNTGGIYNYNFSAVAQTTLRNTILKNGAGGGNLLNANGEILSLGHNLADDFTGDFSNPGTGPAGYLNASGDIRNTDPLLGPLQDNGGSTPTHALLTGSPAINAGENTGSNYADQRGYLRRGFNDIGAFEFNGLRLRITNIARSGNDLVISFDAPAGLYFGLGRKSALTDGWSPIPNIDLVHPASDGIAQIIDPGSADLPRAFYRVELAVP